MSDSFDMDKISYLAGLVDPNARGKIVEGQTPLNEATDFIAYDPKSFTYSEDPDPSEDQPHKFEKFEPVQDPILDVKADDMERNALKDLAESRLRGHIRKQILKILDENGMMAKLGPGPHGDLGRAEVNTYDPFRNTLEDPEEEINDTTGMVRMSAGSIGFGENPGVTGFGDHGNSGPARGRTPGSFSTAVPGSRKALVGPGFKGSR